MENKTPEEILSNIYESINKNDLQICITLNPSLDLIVMAMEEYGKQQYNQAIKDAAEIMNNQ